jgi:environmental stress-induced protein Ves
MKWNRIRLGDVQATPWRNGGGVTRELVVWPAQGEWSWRMSVAEVQASGPFSRFKGITRWFAVVKGAGVQLDVDGQCTEITSQDDPFTFDGTVLTQCRLLAGPSQDFNLMVRGNAGASHMQRIQGRFGGRLNAPGMIAVYAIDAEASVHFDKENLLLEATTLAWRNVPVDATVAVECSNALWMEVAA